jgi:PadR family transcriptional regulator, regulatory protein PadR
LKKADLLQGTLDLVVLRLLKRGPLNGWDVTQAIRTVSRGLLDVNYGSVYPALRRLEVRGLVQASWDVSDNNRRARYYELTAAGRRELTAEQAQWQRFATALGLILASD